MKTIAVLECSDCKNHFQDYLHPPYPDDPYRIPGRRAPEMIVCPHCLTTMRPLIIEIPIQSIALKYKDLFDENDVYLTLGDMI